MKGKWTLVQGLLLGAVFIALWLHFIDTERVLGYLRELRLGWVGASAACYLLAYFLRSLRWRALLSPVMNLPVSRAWSVWMSGHFLNYIIPIRAGELAKSWLLKQTRGVRISHTLPSVFVDKLFDSLGILVVLSLLPFLHVNVSRSMLVLMILLVGVLALALVILVAAAISKEFVVKLLRGALFFVPKRFEQRIEETIDLFVEGVGLFRHHMRLLPVVILLTISAVLVDSLFFGSLFLAFRQQVAFPLILFGYTLIYLSYILPHPPAQIGSNELIMVVIFSVGLGLDRDMVSAVMGFSHLMTGLIIVGVGLLTSSINGVKVMDVFRMRTQETEDS